MFPLENCTKEYKKLYEIYNKAEEILNNIGLTDITVKDIRLNNRLTTTLAWYISGEEVIEVSTRHFACGSYDEIMCTIIHEISHNICENRHGEQKEWGGHTAKWWKIADEITEKTGYNIQPCSKVTEDESKIIYTPEYVHRFKCKKCGYEYDAYSFKEDPKKVRKQKCLGCLARHKLHGEEYSKGEFECIKSGICRYKQEYITT